MESKPTREPSARQKKLLSVFGAEPQTLKDLGNKAFARERPEAKRFSWARNNIRWLLANKYVKRIKKGVYQKVPKKTVKSASAKTVPEQVAILSLSA